VKVMARVPRMTCVTEQFTGAAIAHGEALVALSKKKD